MLGKFNWKKFALRRFNEYLPFIVALVLWWICRPLILALDPTAATDDAGLLMALLFGMALYFGACAFSWLALRLIFPKIGRFVDNEFEKGFDEEQREDKMIYSLILFAVYFFGAIIIFASVV